MGRPLLASSALLALAGCHSKVAADAPQGVVRIAHLARGDGEGFAALRADFRRSNPGHDIVWLPDLRGLGPVPEPRAVFVQSGAGQARIAAAASEVGIGDLILLRAGEAPAIEGELAGLAFHLPDELPAELPAFLRPDWDPRITDTPGGCATETGAYRRILLTWLAENGPYVHRGLNAHRVRISDSFTHYHPRAGGFDELYLVQMVQPGARVLTSVRVARIEAPGTVTAEEAAALFETHPLAAGDLVYLPRGTAHRGVGGVLAQVIAVPGFVPGAEIGLDHCLRAINERLGLTGERALPFHAPRAGGPVVK